MIGLWFPDNLTLGALYIQGTWRAPCLNPSGQTEEYSAGVSYVPLSQQGHLYKATRPRGRLHGHLLPLGRQYKRTRFPRTGCFPTNWVKLYC